MTRLYKATARFLRDEGGASLIEYSILIGIITVVAIGSIVTMGARVGDWWGKLVTDTPATPNGPAPK